MVSVQSWACVEIQSRTSPSCFLSKGLTLSSSWRAWSSWWSSMSSSSSERLKIKGLDDEFWVDVNFRLRSEDIIVRYDLAIWMSLKTCEPYYLEITASSVGTNFMNRISFFDVQDDCIMRQLNCKFLVLVDWYNWMFAALFDCFCVSDVWICLIFFGARKNYVHKRKSKTQIGF